MRRGWTIIEPPFVDFGISGTKDSRPALNLMMEAIRKRQVDVVFVWRFDRFARSLTHLVQSLEYFRQRSIDFVSYSENIDTATSQGKLVFSIFAAIAEFERTLIIERIHSGLRRARAGGKHCGRPGTGVEDTTAILELRGKGSLRWIAAQIGCSKSLVQKVLSTNPPSKVAQQLDGEQTLSEMSTKE